MKNKGLWALAGAAVAFVLYEHFFASSAVPAGYVQFGPVTPGLTTVPRSNWSGQGAFVLPTGAKWSSGQRGIVGSAQAIQSPITMPTGNAPLLLSALQTGTGLFLGWVDASGQPQTSVFVFS
jgi:hypothetical protein